MDTSSEPVYFYFQFINKLVRAGRGEETKIYFRFESEIDRSDFIKFANKFIEDYHATVSPEFAITHRMKFRFITITETEYIVLRQDVRSKEVGSHPEINGGLLYIDPGPDKDGNDRALDASIFRQACFIQRERLKLFLTISGFIVAVASVVISIIFKK